jgi:hypothetical protein
LQCNVTSLLGATAEGTFYYNYRYNWQLDFFNVRVRLSQVAGGQFYLGATRLL